MSYFIGIDVGKEKLDCACLRNKEQNKARIMECSNNAIDFKLLVEWSENTTSLSIKELSFLIEPTSIYHERLVGYLYALEAKVFMANTGRVRKFAEGIGVLSKNDIINANVLARYGLMSRKLIAWKSVPREISELKSLINRLNTLEKELQREKNRQEKINECNDVHPPYRKTIHYKIYHTFRKRNKVISDIHS